MTQIFQDIPPNILLLCLAVAALAGLVKGVVGFAMPMILVSLLGSIVAPQTALAGLILPTLVTNAMQFGARGVSAVADTVRRFRGFLLAGGIALVLSSQFVTQVPTKAFLAILGVLIVAFALLRLSGRNLTIPSHRAKRVELVIGAFAGFIGGLSGVWGPPTVSYLTALGTEKEEQIRIQGVIYFLGAVMLTAAHLKSGILTVQTGLFSAALVPPAMLGMWLGGRIRAGIDQSLFQKATLVVLFLAGLNLLRRALF